MMRLVTINLWGASPVLQNRLLLAKAQLAALSPDVIGIQEVMLLDGHNGRTTADWLADELGMHVVCEVASQGSGVGEGLAILARHRISEHRARPLPASRPDEGRILLSARVELPEGTVWCHTTHLHWRLDDGVAREQQVVFIDEVLGAIRTDLPQLLCGDFNAPPAHDEMRFLRGETTLAGRRTHYQDAWARLHPLKAGHTWCTRNPLTQSQRSLDVDRRIDYIFVTSRAEDGRGAIQDAQVVLNGRDEHGDCASDHYGVMADVQIAPS